MQERKIIKQYLTIVRGVPSPSQGKGFEKGYRDLANR